MSNLTQSTTLPQQNNQDEMGNEQAGDKTRSQQQIDASSWLPITADRNAKWYYSAFHNVTATVGAGILGLPYAMSQLGWIPGITVISLSWLITFYSFWQLVELHESVPGKRFDRYPELGQHCFGPKLGYWIIMPQQTTVQVASGIVYCVTGGKSLKKVFELLIPAWGDIRTTYFILFFICLQFVISQSPNFNSLKGVSLLAAVMSCGYSLIAFVASTIQGTKHHENMSYGVRSSTTAGQVFDILNGCGTIAFAFAGHSVSLEIQATIPSTPEKPSKYAMWKGVVVAYVIVAFCYVPVAVSGYWAYGHLVEDDVLISLDKPAWLIAAANLMVFLHVIGSYQVFSMPVFDQIEQYLVENRGFTPGRPLRIIARSLYVAAAGFVAMCIPFFGGLLGLFGGLVFSSISFYMPCVMWLITQKPKAFSFHWLTSWVCIVMGVLLAVLSPIGGARTIYMQAKTYRFFS
ncbi:lysine histidine transporter-like 5 [Rosa sericea]